MQTGRKIFDYDQRNGLNDYEADVVRILLEDDEFFKTNIDSIGPNNFEFGCFRAIVREIKDAWDVDNVRISVESADIILRRLTRAAVSEIEFEEFKACIDMLKARTVTDERKQVVISEFKYWKLFYSFIKAWNITNDAISSDGIGSTQKLVKLSKELVGVSNDIKRALEYVEGTNGDWTK